MPERAAGLASFHTNVRSNPPAGYRANGRSFEDDVSAHSPSAPSGGGKI